ncbi:unnamed protein product [Lactuca virosa]|uniref:Uncharacterized protein n=1 Tax=Lactuca virosa TaxID=75947 RepID=A0AAU9LYK0_9ASTR|nr:unnamed protein product [Lactuca virosa]
MKVLKEKKLQESSSKMRCYQVRFHSFLNPHLFSFFDSISPISNQFLIRVSSLPIINSFSVVQQRFRLKPES